MSAKKIFSHNLKWAVQESACVTIGTKVFIYWCSTKATPDSNLLCQLKKNFGCLAFHLINLMVKLSYCSGLEIQNVLSSSQLDTVRNVLRWVYLLEYNRTSQLESISITLKISRVMCVFLTGIIFSRFSEHDF